jgi:hypothetical protein
LPSLCINVMHTAYHLFELFKIIQKFTSRIRDGWDKYQPSENE